MKYTLRDQVREDQLINTCYDARETFTCIDLYQYLPVLNAIAYGEV